MAVAPAPNKDTDAAAPGEEAADVVALTDEFPGRTIYQRMISILDELPAIGKDQRNTQQNFNFRGHDDVLNALTPLLAKHGVFIVPRTLERATAQRATSSGKAMYEVNLLIEYTFYGAAGDSVTASAWGEGTDMGDKATMKAGTMAFKQVLNQAFAINTEEGAAHDTDKTTVEETVAGGGQRTQQQRGGQQQQAAPAPRFTLETALGVLAGFTDDPKPWIKEATVAFYPDVEEFPAKFGDLPEAVRVDLFARLKKVCDYLEEEERQGFQVHADANKTQELLSRAFAVCFDELEVKGPETFALPVQF